VLASALVVVAALALLWMVGSAVLRALAWFFVGAMAISLVTGIPVPTGVVVGAVVRIPTVFVQRFRSIPYRDSGGSRTSLRDTPAVRV
jgi:hypothetical protein